MPLFHQSFHISFCSYIHTNSNIIYFYTNITIFNSLKCDGLKLRTGIEVSYIDSSYNNASNVLLTASAIYDNYLKKTDASNTYVTKQDYDKRFDTGFIALTEEGFNKIKAMSEEVGTTITLTATTDFSENVQLSHTYDKELILGVKYDVDNIYRNIHVMPNQ